MIATVPRELSDYDRYEALAQARRAVLDLVARYEANADRGTPWMATYNTEIARILRSALTATPAPEVVEPPELVVDEATVAPIWDKHLPLGSSERWGALSACQRDYVVAELKGVLARSRPSPAPAPPAA